MSELLTWAIMIAAAEEARPREVRVAPVVREAVGRGRTSVRRARNVRLPAELLRERGSGRLVELAAVSPSDAVVLEVEIDGSTVLGESVGSLASYSPHVEFVDAYRTPEGEWVVRLTDLRFSSSIRVYASPEEGEVRLKEVVSRLELW